MASTDKSSADKSTQSDKVVNVITPTTESVTDSKSTDVKSTDGGSNNPQMANLIETAKQNNQKLNNKVIDFDSTSVSRIMSKSEQVRMLLRDCGMDSQMAERAYNELVKLFSE